ncbi:MAG TPA: hypothetical protein VMM92_00570, partial [Thermoanaerobaculia bacterium]|nr:hypothetical protein [Thermoanaerobaculia bacterium]
LTATILPSPPGTTVANQATIAYDGDGNGTNESSAQTDDPSTPGAGNPTMFSITGEPAPEVPALTPLGLLLLSGILAVAALTVLRRRRQAER